TFPPGLIYGLSPNRIQLDRLQLTFAGLLHCENAAADVDLFTATVGYLARRQREFVPASATHVETLAVTSDEVRRDVPSAASSPPRAVERLYDLIMQDPYAFNGGGKTAEGSWTVTVGPEIRRYRGIQTVEDYLSRRQPAAAASDPPRMSMPLKV